MRTFKKQILSGVLFLGLVFGSCCVSNAATFEKVSMGTFYSSDPANDTNLKEAPKLNKTSVTLKMGPSPAAVQLKVSNTSEKNITWSSKDKSIAAVSKSGKVTAKKAGTTVITAKVGKKKLDCKVTVKATIKLNKTKITHYAAAKKTIKLKATVYGNKSKVSWKSSNKSVATVSQSGVVTVKKAGKAVITAQIKGASATCTITATSWKDLYREFLTEKRWRNIAFKDVKDYGFYDVALSYDREETFFTVVDIDNNGIGELILNRGLMGETGGPECAVFTVKNGKVTFVGTAGSSIDAASMEGEWDWDAVWEGRAYPTVKVNTKYKAICFTYGLSTGTGESKVFMDKQYWTIKNGKKSVVKRLFSLYKTDDKDYLFDVPSAYRSKGYYIGTKKVTKAKYSSEAAKYEKNTKTYKLYKNTSANRKKYLG